MSGKIYLVPNTLGNTIPDTFLPFAQKNKITSLKYLIVENTRNARRYLKLIDPEVIIDDITFFELNKHTDPLEISTFLDPASEGHDIGIISEAGLPGIADPGAIVVALAHEKNIQVVPLVGPSSIFMSLMASGLNGQSFRFLGYLPVNSKERTNAIRVLESRALKENETQIFIETPYRNNAILEDLIQTCNADTRLTIAVDITTDEEKIKTKTIASWKKQKPDIHKRPAVFLIGK